MVQFISGLGFLPQKLNFQTSKHINTSTLAGESLFLVQRYKKNRNPTKNSTPEILSAVRYFFIS